MSNNSPPAALVLYESDETGGERCAVRTAGSETGVQRGIPSDDGDKIGAVAVVLSETGTEMGSSDPALKCKNSDGGAMISVLEDAEKHSVLWAHDKTGEIPHTANAELSPVLRLQFQFWKTINKHVHQHDAFYPPVKLFRQGIRIIYSKPKGGVDGSAQSRAILRYSISSLKGAINCQPDA
jgi:hypothetical protein